MSEIQQSASARRTARQVVFDAYDGVRATGDLDVFLKDFADDAVLEESDALPEGYRGRHHGKPAIKATITRIMNEFWKDFSFIIEKTVSDDEYVIVSGLFSATGPKTGKKVSFPLMEMWRVRDEKVVWMRPVYGDHAQIADALGDVWRG